ncbi:MAG: Ig-like domain-containing protein [Flavobacteriales bacterium]|nr:Ig-like domain-containing protein [Flavobacteriales bacterium]
MSCATMDVPTGGIKDTTPPKIVASYPDTFSTNFNDKLIKIEFNEYFVLNSLEKNLIISPPLTAPYNYKIKNKTLFLHLHETLKPNTTYQLQFGNSIADYTAGNKSNNLKLIFSTGSYIDSGSISGNIKNAFTTKSVANSKILLFTSYSDSNLYKNPYYVTLSENDGNFSFTNIDVSRNYYIYAFNDENGNNKLDTKELVYFPVNENQTIENLQKPITIFLSSNEVETPLKLNSIAQHSKTTFSAKFNHAISSTNISITTTPDWSGKETYQAVPYITSKNKDSLYLYLNAIPSDFNDSIQLNIIIDSNTFHKTIHYKQVEKSEYIMLKIDSKNIHPQQPISLFANYPIKSTNSEKITLQRKSDSSFIPIKSIRIVDFNHLVVEAKLEENTNYNLIIDKNAITFSNHFNDFQDTISFKTKNSQETGELNFSIKFDSTISQDHKFYFVLESEKEILAQTEIYNDTVLEFNYLKPQKINAYVFKDLDENKKWSSANYTKKVNFEPIWRPKNDVEIRANWKTKDILIEIK